MKVVVDTNVFVSAILSPTGPPAQVFDLVVTRRVIFLVSPLILKEYQEVLTREKLSLRREAVKSFFRFVEAYAEVVPDIPSERSLPDSDDLPFLECALAGSADYLITGNKRHFPAGSCDPIKVVSPSEFVIRGVAK